MMTTESGIAQVFPFHSIGFKLEECSVARVDGSVHNDLGFWNPPDYFESIEVSTCLDESAIRAELSRGAPCVSEDSKGAHCVGSWIKQH